MTGRRPLGANIHGAAAQWVLRRIENDVRESVRHFRTTGQPEIAQEIATAYADIREAAIQWQESRQGTTARQERLPVTTAPGSAELPKPASVVDLGLSPLVACEVGDAARTLNLTGRRVRQLLASGDLPGRKHGGQWYIDRDAVTRYANDRRLTA